MFHTNFKNCTFENINASDFDLRAGLLIKNNFIKCNFFNSCFRGSKLTENNINNLKVNNCDMKNIIFESNNYTETSFSYSNLFKSMFKNENLKTLELKSCNTFLCIFNKTSGLEILDVDKYSIIN